MPDQVVNFPRDTTMSRMADAQEKTNEILAAIAAGSAGAAYTDTVFAALLDGSNTTDIFWQWWPLSDGEGETKYSRLERFALMLQRAWGAKICPRTTWPGAARPRWPPTRAPPRKTGQWTTP